MNRPDMNRPARTEIAPQPGIMDIAPYQGGASQVAGVARVTKLSSNENPFGPSPLAVEALRASAAELHRYPPTDHAALRAAIGEVHGLDPGRIICGVGSDEIITFLCQAYAGPGTEVIHTEHGFSMYRISALAASVLCPTLVLHAADGGAVPSLAELRDCESVCFIAYPVVHSATKSQCRCRQLPPTYVPASKPLIINPYASRG